MIFECTGFNSFNSFSLRRCSQFVLNFASNAEFFSNVFSRNTHMVVVECVPQAVFDHFINELAVAHTIAPTSFLYEIGCLRHVFHAACNDNVGIAGFNNLCCQRYATQTGTADFVDCHSRSFNRHACFNHSLTSRILAEAGL